MSLDALSEKAINDAAHLLSVRGLFGLVWFDEDLLVTSQTGSIASFAKTGAPITEVVAALFGFEDNIRALKRASTQTIHIPNVAVISEGTPPLRLDHHVFWHPERQQYLLLLARAPSQNTLEVQLYEENRRRRLAEEKIVLQSAELQRANEELVRANRDLTEFAYVISHDLNAPLRALRYHAEDIASKLKDNDDPAVRSLLDGVNFQSRRMSLMLRDLLAYSRIGRKEEAKELVDTAGLIATIVKSLPRPKTLSVEVRGVWPMLKTYPAPLDLVLRNLIDNAIKHHDTGQGRIEVISVPAASGMVITVGDDGPGIDPKYHDAVFQPFCKLQVDQPSGAMEGRDGSGIGLALVRRTMEVLGARIQLHSNPGTARGSQFVVFWPELTE